MSIYIKRKPKKGMKYNMKKIIAMVAILLSLSLITASSAAPSVDARSSILMEMSSKTAIVENNADARVSIASVTKIMTTLLAMEAIERGELSYTDIITTSAHAESMGGSQVYLEVGEQMTVDDILKAVVVSSANDAAVALAEHIGGTYENFVKMMNDRAKSLGLKNTNFLDSCGLTDDKNHHSSARDIAIIAGELMKHDDVKKYTLIWMDSLRGGEFELANTNKLLKTYNGITGLKTGFTDEAMYCMVATAERNGVEYCAVVLGAPTTQERFDGCARLLNYGFDNFKIADRESKGAVIEEVKVKNGKEKTVNAVMKDDFAAVVEKSVKNIERNIVLNEKIKAPLKKGDVIGYIEFLNGDKVVAKGELVAENDVPKKSFFGVIASFYQSFLGIF